MTARWRRPVSPRERLRLLAGDHGDAHVICCRCTRCGADVGVVTNARAIDRGRYVCGQCLAPVAEGFNPAEVAS